MRLARGRTRMSPGWICSSCAARPLSTSIWHHKKVSKSKAINDLESKKSRLPSNPVRTRFAPSPTGNLHLGSLRTALFNYLLAKRTGGQFLLRVEDTDRKRTIPGAEERLKDDLTWAGLRWDEGPGVGGPYGPYRQSERTATYQSHVQDLVITRKAYRCFCSTERLDALARSREEQGLLAGYDRRCADVSDAESDERAANGESHVVRLLQPTKDERSRQYFSDIIYGQVGMGLQRNIVLKEGIYDDQILLKSDGHPTYHLANVVDDHLMKITHVIRGTEWMPSTPLHLDLYRAFGWKPPEFAHVPLLVDEHGRKLSKRSGDIDITSFRETQGVLPDALVNFAALLGWSHQRKSDVMDLRELSQVFDLKLTKGNTTVAFEKLAFLQKAHAQRYAAEGGPPFQVMVERVCKAVRELRPELLMPHISHSSPSPAYVSSILQAGAKTYTNPVEFVNHNIHFFTPLPTPLEPYLALSSTIPLSSLRTAASALSLVPTQHWNASIFKQSIAAYAGPEGTDPRTWNKELYHLLRWALAGSAPGPGIPETMEILGREVCVQRFSDAIQALYALEQEANMAETRPNIQLLQASK